MVSRICTARDCLTNKYRDYSVRLGEDPTRLHRKLWEFYAICDTLHEYGVLDTGKRGIGFAVGTEPLSAYFAHLGCLITASDYVDSNSSWQTSNQMATSVSSLNTRGICNDTDFGERVRFRHIDMNNIPEDECSETYDFLWSSCAMEHIGGIENGLQFAVNALQCLKPGGIAVHTTEFNCCSNTITINQPGCCIFRKKDIEQLHTMISPEYATMLPMDYNTGDHYLDTLVDTVPYRQDFHIKLNLLGETTTSCIIIIVKR